jgi:hypothetical protein
MQQGELEAGGDRRQLSEVGSRQNDANERPGAEHEQAAGQPATLPPGEQERCDSQRHDTAGCERQATDAQTDVQTGEGVGCAGHQEGALEEQDADGQLDTTHDGHREQVREIARQRGQGEQQEEQADLEAGGAHD